MARAAAVLRVMRHPLLLLPILGLLLAAAPAHADASIESPARPHTPYGPRCDAALAQAQEQFTSSYNPVKFHVRERTLTGRYEWSDMCGVWGRYTVELARDGGVASHGWRWKTTRDDDPNDGAEVRRDGTRRRNGWRASIRVQGDSESYGGQTFIDAFRPALEICLDEAARAPR